MQNLLNIVYPNLIMSRVIRGNIKKNIEKDPSKTKKGFREKILEDTERNKLLLKSLEEEMKKKSVNH